MIFLLSPQRLRLPEDERAEPRIDTAAQERRNGAEAGTYCEPVPKPLLTADALAALLARPNPPTLLDVRWKLRGPSGHADYLAGHLPTAVFVDLEQELCGPAGAGGRHPLPDPVELQAALRAAGVSAGRPVVCYDYGDGMAAARTWWTLRWAGHPAVYVLDGGYPAWPGPWSAQPEKPEPGDFEVRPGHLPVLDADDAGDLALYGVLIDARAPERYRGETEPIDPVAGHIPGAVNIPYAMLVNADGTLRSDVDGVLPANVEDIGAYCGSGVTAAHTILALHQIGREDAALYVGSWSHWITDPDRPIATDAP
jgi:thiosulfate/3-mercaptopyruvate sulfurtransferase